MQKSTIALSGIIAGLAIAFVVSTLNSSPVSAQTAATRYAEERAPSQ